MAATSKQRKLNVGIQHPLAVCITDIHSNAYITEIQHGDPAFTGTGATWLHPGGRYLRPTCTFFGFPSNSGRQTERPRFPRCRTGGRASRAASRSPRRPSPPRRWQEGGAPYAPCTVDAARLHAAPHAARIRIVAHAPRAGRLRPVCGAKGPCAEPKRVQVSPHPREAQGPCGRLP